MATLRELKGRIGSVASSEKITGAMKMISSAKMHKSEQALKRLVPYRALIEDIMGNLLSSDAEFASPLTAVRDVHHMSVVVFGSDEGLCGAYNANIYTQLMDHIAEIRNELGSDVTIDVLPVGVKMEKATRKLSLKGVKVVAVPEGICSKSDGATVKTFLDSLCMDYAQGRVDRVDILCMNFISISRQRLRVTHFMPLSTEALAQGLTVAKNRPCLFEPSPEEIFVSIVPMYLLASMQEMFVENRASEQAARVMAMQAANDNAKKLLEELRLVYNKLRQQSITTELLDIVGGQIR